MSMVSLSDLLAGARPDTHCVAIQDGRQITLARLRADVSHNADRLSTRAIRRAAVVCKRRLLVHRWRPRAGEDRRRSDFAAERASRHLAQRSPARLTDC